MEKFQFMEETWGFLRAPINADGIYRPSDPFSRSACKEQVEEFERKFILGGIRGGLTYGYLWSLPHPRFPEPTGTGYGKTRLMRYSEAGISRDWGEEVLRPYELKSKPRIVAAYTSLDNEDTRGLYALLFSAVERWADSSQSSGPDGRSVLGAARAAIVARLGCDDEDEAAIRAAVEQARHHLPGGGTLPPLREAVLRGFCSPDETALQEELAQMTPMMRARNGLAFFEAVFACLAAAGVEHVFLFYDQLEYMVTNRAVTKPQKSREIARLRTVFTQHAGLANRCHVVLTFHDRASGDLREFWESNRLPSFDPRAMENQNAVVALRGLESPERIADLALPYFDAVRAPAHPKRGSLEPLDQTTFGALWEKSKARPGIILRRIAAALDLAASENRPVVGPPLMARILDIPMEDPDTVVGQPSGDVSSLVG